MSAPWVPNIKPGKVGDTISFSDANGHTYTNISVIAIGYAWVIVNNIPVWIPAVATVSYIDQNGLSRTAALGFA